MSIAVSRAWVGALRHRATRRATRTMLSALALLAPCLPAGAQGAATLSLSREGRTSHSIVVPSDPSPAESLAASELSAYLHRITGATFPIVRGEAPARAIVIATGRSDAVAAITGEAYSIAVRGERLHLTGGSPRATLYAAYDFLERLGCEWLAPDFAFYAGRGEVVPRSPTLVYAGPREVVESPTFTIRKLDVEEGLSHDTETLRRIVAWMPKARFNTLMVPMDYGGRGRVRWDAWRDALVPELERRDLVVEVGGHGYQNFLGPEMEEGALFDRHPEWFGRDSSCRPSRAERLVFDTDNDAAVDYLVRNVVDYAETRPEIDILDFWPPDGARWAECDAWVARGTPADRQARLVVAVDSALRRVRPDIRLEMIAYAHAKEPPRTVALPPSVLVDICPIGQNFDVQIDDPAGHNNAIYVRTIRDWRAAHGGPLGIYTYYRKYAWRSLPIVLPHYMQRDMRWYAAVPMQGVSTYAEPGDWATYELNHFVLGRLAWNPDVDVDALVERFARARYGPAAGAATAALRSLEDVFRLRASIPYSAPDSATQLAAARTELAGRLTALRAADVADTTAADVRRLSLMLEFAMRDLTIQHARARGASAVSVAGMVEQLVAFLGANATEGVFLVREGDLARYQRHYAREGLVVSSAPEPGA